MILAEAIPLFLVFLHVMVQPFVRESEDKGELSLPGQKAWAPVTFSLALQLRDAVISLEWLTGWATAVLMSEALIPPLDVGVIWVRKEFACSQRFYYLNGQI